MKTRFRFLFPLFFPIFAVSCVPQDDEIPTWPDSGYPAFQDDVDFLRRYGRVEVLQSTEGAVIAVSPLYQGRVITSATAPQGTSLGWINRNFIESGQSGTPFDNYGGEDRFWLGPEAGQFGFYFPPESSFTLASWQVPDALQAGEWRVEVQDTRSITFRHEFRLANYSGFPFHFRVERTIRLLSDDAIRDRFGIEPEAPTLWVAFESENSVTNLGGDEWTREEGLPSIWILGQFPPFGTTDVILPFTGPSDPSPVNDRYFGDVPSDRLQIRHNYVLFRCDGQFRSKIGIGPGHARPIIGAYSPALPLLTLVTYTLPEQPGDYVNSLWEHQEEPYQGDVVHSYNDGPTEPGAPSLGGFYELETSSPALSLAPGETATHFHRTLHLLDSAEALDRITRETLGASILSGTGD